MSGCEVSEFGWEVINWLIEANSSGEVCEFGWKIINWLVELVTSCEVSECGWEVANWLVEMPQRNIKMSVNGSWVVSGDVNITSVVV
jgi:hypothetical protein